MKRITYRCRDDEKYHKLRIQLAKDKLTFQELTDKCMDLYLKGKLENLLKGDEK